MRRGRYSRALYLRLSLLLVSGALLAQTPDNPLAADANAASAGNSVFRLYCTPCHGIRGQGGRGPDLTKGVYSSGERDSDLFRSISNGVPGTDMSGFGGDIIPDDVWRIVAYIRSIARHDTTPVSGDRTRGETLFWNKGACGACHIVRGRGGRSGPELTRIGVQRSLAYLRDAIVDPNKEVAPGWATIVVTRRDGTKLTGIERGFDNFSAQLIDLGGNYYSFLRADVASIERENRSVMPSDYGTRLTAAEIDDLLAYLVSLRGAGSVP